MIELRDYQHRFVKAVHGEVRDGHDRVLGVMATGGGKRYVLCWWMENAIKQGRRVGMVTDRRILIDQAAEECRAHGIDFGIVMGDVPRRDDAPVQLCSIHTIVRRQWQDMPRPDLWLIDEAHKESRNYDELLARAPAKCFGVTATPLGRDGRNLVDGNLFQSWVEPIKNSELIRDRYLMPITIHCPFAPDLKGVRLESTDEVAKRVQQCIVNADLFREYAKFAHLPCIVFAPGVVFARGLAEQFTKRGYPAEVVEASTDRTERREVFQRFDAGDLPILVSVDVLREGFDAPAASLGIDLQPTNQLRVFWQKVGRIKRPAPGKTEAIWLDCAGTSWNFPHPDLDPSWPTYRSERNATEIIQATRKREGYDPWQCRACMMTLGPNQSLFDGKCPNCGAEIRRAKRYIRTEDGRLRKVSAAVKKVNLAEAKRKKEIGVWQGVLWGAGKKGYSYRKARANYKWKTGSFPPNYFPWIVEDENDWRRKVVELFPKFAPKEQTGS